MTSAEFRAIRRQIGVNQTELGRRTGMPQQSISRIESGERQPTKQQAAAITMLKFIWDHNLLDLLIKKMEE